MCNHRDLAQHLDDLVRMGFVSDPSRRRFRRSAAWLAAGIAIGPAVAALAGCGARP